jgi:hypothetical protein
MIAHRLCRSLAADVARRKAARSSPPFRHPRRLVAGFNDIQTWHAPPLLASTSGSR